MQEKVWKRWRQVQKDEDCDDEENVVMLPIVTTTMERVVDDDNGDEGWKASGCPARERPARERSSSLGGDVLQVQGPPTTHPSECVVCSVCVCVCVCVLASK